MALQVKQGGPGLSYIFWYMTPNYLRANEFFSLKTKAPVFCANKVNRSTGAYGKCYQSCIRSRSLQCTCTYVQTLYDIICSYTKSGQLYEQDESLFCKDDHWDDQQYDASGQTCHSLHIQSETPAIALPNAWHAFETFALFPEYFCPYWNNFIYVIVEQRLP